jgi:hypothetical protein
METVPTILKSAWYEVQRIVQDFEEKWMGNRADGEAPHL